MSPRPFRFIHAADLHLDQPMSGVSDVPGHLDDLLVDCPLTAAKRLFDLAIEHRVDFVILSGDVVDIHRASPREMTFLAEQFQRLNQNNIPVYWAGGEVDSADWPSQYALPGNVKQASRLHMQRHRHEIDGVAVCELAGRSHEHGQPPRPSEFSNARDDLFSIAVAHVEQADRIGDLGIRYWALGGLHGRSTMQQSHRSIAHFPGTHQGRKPSEFGSHGCTLVEVDERSEVRLTLLATDVLRWEPQKLTLGMGADRAELERVLRDRTARLIAEAAATTLLVEWTISCDGAILADLRRGKLAAELVELLNREFGQKGSLAWTVAIHPDLTGEMPAAWMREETLRGDYLRAIHELIRGEGAQDSYLTLVDAQSMQFTQDALAGNEPMQRLAALDNPAARRRILQQAGWLGADLLSPEEAVQ